MADDAFAMLDWNAAETLPGFLARAPRLSQRERATILDAAIATLRGFYAHLPMKRVAHGIDPVGRLAALRRTLADVTDDIAFHHAVSAVFASLHDLHTIYVLPEFYAHATATLPFELGVAHGKAGDEIIITRLATGFAADPFQPGVVALSWNGIPIARAVALLADRSGGANPPAAQARAVAMLTARPMTRMPPPDETWVEIEYCAADGSVQLLRCPWRMCPLHPEAAHPVPAPHGSLDIEGDALRRSHARLFAPPPARKPAHPAAVAVASSLPALFAGWTGCHAGRPFGHLRIRSFKTFDATGFLAELRRLLALLPPEGLILDVRDNSGGLLAAAERALQYFSSHPIAPALGQFVATPETLALCRRQTPAHADAHCDLSPWIASTLQGLATGAAHSGAFPLTDPAACNDTGRVYPGPVVLLTSALCYSATDIFTGGFQDHAIGPIIGVDDNIGAGGANTWTYDLLRQLVPAAHLPALPHGAGFHVALRRTLRVGPNAGLALEETGIHLEAGDRYSRTRHDLLHDDAGLIAHAAARLAYCCDPDAREPSVG